MDEIHAVTNFAIGQAAMLVTVKTAMCCIIVTPEVEVVAEGFRFTGRTGIQMKGFPTEETDQLVAGMLFRAAEALEHLGEQS